MISDGSQKFHDPSFIGLMVVLCCALCVCSQSTNKPGRSTVVLSAPDVADTYYNNPDPAKNRYWDLIWFHRNYSEILSAHGVNVVINCDPVTCDRLYEIGVPHDILWEGGIRDIWMRDFTRVGPSKQAGFKYRPAYIEGSDESRRIQRDFLRALRRAGLMPTWPNPEILDGGNVVDNYLDDGYAIVTDRYIHENAEEGFCDHITIPEPEFWIECEAYLKEIMKDATGYSKIAIIPEIDGDTTGHSDGVVSFIDHDVLAYSQLSSDTLDWQGGNAQQSMVDALKAEFGTSVTLVPVRYEYPTGNAGPFQFTSSCGTHVNALYTEDKLFVPTFGQDPENVKQGLDPALDDEVIDVIQGNTHADVVRVPVPKRICEMGGSVRCLSWFLTGPNADKLVKYVKDNCY